MISLSSVEAQLARAGCKISSWGRGEVKELCHILTPDEIISQATNGYYNGGFALLVATNMRLILVDRKPMFLTLDAISYGMIQEVQLNYRLLNSTIYIYTSNKVLVFTSWSHTRLRAILDYTQHRVMELRMQYASLTPVINQSQQEPDLSQIPDLPVPTNQSFNPAVNDSQAGFQVPSRPVRYKQPLLTRRN